MILTKKININIIAIVDQGISSLASFASALIIGRICSKEEFGLFTLGATIIVLFTGIQSSLISSAYTCYFPRLKGAAQRIYSGSSLIHQFGLSLIALFLISVTGLLLFIGVVPIKIDSVIWALFLTLSFIMFHQFVRTLLFAHLNFSVAILVDLAVLIIQLTGLLLFAHFGLLSAKGAFWIIGTATGIAGITWLFLNKEKFLVNKNKIISDLRINVSFGKWVLGSVLVFYFYSQGYYWFLSQMRSVADTGALAACQGTVNIINPFLLGIYNVLRPEASRSFAVGGIVALRKVVHKALILISIPMIIFSLIILFKGNEFVILLYGAKYGGISVVVNILALNMFVMAMCYPFDYGLWAMEKTALNFFITLSASIVAIALAAGLVNRFGVLGAALGLLTGNMVMLLLRFIAFSRISSSLKK